MNERIQKLAEQCGFRSNPDVYDRNQSFDITKFAELIVQECANALSEMHHWQSINNQNYPTVWHDAVDQGIEQIKEHFGVEE